MGLKALIGSARSMKHYFIASCLVFATGVLLGCLYSGMFQAYLEMILKQLGDAARHTAESDNKSAAMFGFIFFNNLRISVLVMFAGALFGLIPLYLLVSNGLVVGYLAAKSAESGHLDLFLKGVIPHGIIEIPAIIVASSYGIRLGFLLLETLRNLPFAEGRKRMKSKYKAFLKLSVPYLGLVVVMLLIAAGIESTLTVWLIGR